MRLADLLANCGHCSVTVDGVDIAVDYRTHFLTPQFESNLKTLGDSPEQVKKAIEMLCDLIIKWDVQGDDGKMLPLTPEALHEAHFTGDLAGTFLSQVFEKGLKLGEVNSAP